MRSRYTPSYQLRSLKLGDAAFIVSLVIPACANGVGRVVAAGGLYPNEPPGFTMINDNPWNTPGGAGWTGAGTTFSIVQDATAPQSPPNVGAGHLAAGTFCGVAQWSLNFSFPTGMRQLYVSVWYKHVNWLPHPVGSKFLWFKMPEYPTATYTGFGGSNMRVSLYQQGGVQNPALNPNHYPNVVANKQWGDENGAATGTTGYGWLGQWAHLEYLLIQNTGTNFDGVIKMWVNGHQTLNYANIGFSGASDSHTWTAITWNSTWGGGCAPANDQYEYQDHIYLSGSN